MACKYLFYIALLLLSSCNFFSAPQSSGPIICFTFDDAHAGLYSQAMPIMNKYAYRGSCFINSNRIGQANILTLNQVKELRQRWNWEIGGHSLNHEDLPQLSYSEAQTAIVTDFQNLVGWDLQPRSFALPRGECPAEYFPIITSLYENIRGSSDYAMYQPLNRLSLGYFPYQSNWTAGIVTQRIRRGIANRENLIIIGFHSVGGNPISDYANCPVEQFAQIMADVSSLGLQVLPLAEAIELLE